MAATIRLTTCPLIYANTLQHGGKLSDLVLRTSERLELNIHISNIKTNEIPGERSGKNICSHVKITCYLAM